MSNPILKSNSIFKKTKKQHTLIVDDESLNCGKIQFVIDLMEEIPSSIVTLQRSWT